MFSCVVKIGVGQNSLRNTAIVVAPVVRLGVALGTVLRQFIATIPAVVLAITEQPLGNATVVGLSRTTGPAGGTVSLATHVSRFVRVISAIVVEVAHPQLRNAAPILAAELRLRVAWSFV